MKRLVLLAVAFSACTHHHRNPPESTPDGSVTQEDAGNEPVDPGTGTPLDALPPTPPDAVLASDAESPEAVPHGLDATTDLPGTDPDAVADAIVVADATVAVDVALPPDASTWVPVDCVRTEGYWRNHESWPVALLTLGTVSYSESEALLILGTPDALNGLVSLASQLIAAKLNVAAGADGSSAASSIAAADALVGDLVVPPVGTGALWASETSALVDALDAFNSGRLGPAHCK